MRLLSFCSCNELKVGGSIYLKGGGNIAAKTLTTICNTVWKCEEVPEDWKSGIVLPLPKKGDMTQCTNWRGISLL